MNLWCQRSCFRMILHVYFAISITVIALIGQVSTQMQICTFTPRMDGVYTNMTLTGTAEVNQEAVTGSNPSFSVNSNSIYYMGMQVVKNGGSGPSIEVEFNVKMINTKSSPDNFNISLTLRNTDQVGISSATMEIRLGNYVQAFWDVGIPAGSVLIGRSYVGYNSSVINFGDSVSIYFMAAPSGKGGVDLPEGNTELFATVYFNYQSTVYGAIIPSICLKRVTVVNDRIFYEQGFPAVTFFIMLIIGILLAGLGLWWIQKRRKRILIFPTEIITRKTMTAAKIGVNPKKDKSSIAWNDSILCILTLKDHLQIYREIDNRDIQSARNIEIDIETETIDVAVQASSLLVQGLRYNGDITKTVEGRVNANMQKQLTALKKKMIADYKKELTFLYTDMEVKKKDKYDDLLRKHEIKKQKISQKLTDLPASEKKSMLESIDQQLQTEMSELTNILTLEQDEKAEELRKKFAISTHVGVTESQQQFINDVIKTGVLNAEKAEWLMKEHKKQQEIIHNLYDDEISRQRMNLEEKVTKRRALALASESQADYDTERLNLISSIEPMINKMRKQKLLSSEKLDEYLNQAKKECQAIKDQMDKEKELKENDLIKKHGQIKKIRLDEKMKEHAKELNGYSSQIKANQTEGPVDPVLYVNGFVKLKSQHRQELTEIEIDIDAIQAKELEMLRNQVTENAKQKLTVVKKSFVDKVKAEGVQHDVIDKLLQTHRQDVKKLESKHLADKQQQEIRLKNELARRKKELEQMREKEKHEQQKVREHEANIVQNLLSMQVAISDEQRQEILREHEKQLVKLENSLTLNKLKQKRMLEEKIAQRKAQKLEELQQKQNAELAKMKKVAENNGEEDDEETHKKEITLIKKHAEQQVALAQGIQLNLEEELKDIQTEMTRDRAIVLREQEERLSAFITSLQIQKAKEITQIEEQHKAIMKLKMGVMNDINDKGILSTQAIEQILRNHEQEHEELNHKLEVEREKKVEAFRVKLEQHRIQRQKSMIQKQKDETDIFLKDTANKPSAKFKCAVLKHKQVVEMEKFRNEMQREISQTLENFRRDFEMQKQKAIQAKEMQLLSGLVKVGQFGRNELTDVLHMLFPGKTEEAVMEILNQIYQDDSSKQKGESLTVSTLAEKINEAQYTQPSMQQSHSVSSIQHPKVSQVSLTPTEENSRNEHTFSLLEGIVSPVEQKNLAKYQNINILKPNNTDITQSYAQRQINEQNMTNQKNIQISNSEISPYNSEVNEEDGYSQSEDDKYQEEDEEVDYIGRTLGMNPPQSSSNYQGRLPPLQTKDKPAPKKKTRLLKKLASKSSTDD